jgi:Protein of unknown function (DUF4019)
MEEDMTRLGRAAGAASILAFLLGVGAAAHIVEQEQAKPSGDEAAAVAAAEAWLHQVDAGHYAESWDQSAAVLRGAVTKSQWEQSLQAVRGQLGKLSVRSLKSAAATSSLPGAPEGKYVVIQFATTFAQRPAVETVTPMWEQGGWRVAGYYVR